MELMILVNEVTVENIKTLDKMLSSIKIKDMFLRIDKQPNKSYKVEIYAQGNFTKDYKKFCERCKEFHCQFYINEEYNCSRCNLKTFIKREELAMSIIHDYHSKKV
jgi:hypothetical protein